MIKRTACNSRTVSIVLLKAQDARINSKMNKLFIILLAVCLVSVHAFVKRDAPEAPKNDVLEDIKKQLEDAGDKISKALKPENIKKSFDDAVGNLNKFVEDFKKPSDAPKA